MLSTQCKMPPCGISTVDWILICLFLYRLSLKKKKGFFKISFDFYPLNVRRKCQKDGVFTRSSSIKRKSQLRQTISFFWTPKKLNGYQGFKEGFLLIQIRVSLVKQHLGAVHKEKEASWKIIGWHYLSNMGLLGL